jgi:3-methyladenine DNA glycosylase/8-oxoguanine DNA glycosylase
VASAAAAAAAEPRIEARAEVRPPWPFRLPGVGTWDGLLRVRDGEVSRLVHVEGEPAVVTARQPALDRVIFASTAGSLPVAEEAIARLRFTLGVDDDLRPFYERFRFDGLIGRALRAAPRLRLRRHPEPWEALAWAVCEQLIEAERAKGIERRLVARWGRRCPRTGLCDSPLPDRLAGVAPAELQAAGLSAGRSLALRRAAREVATGRVDLGADHARGWRRLRAIPEIGAWTVERLALHGQGRYDQLPAGDLAYLKLVGRLLTGNPRARATEDQVREFLAPYGPWAGLAGAHLLAGRRFLPSGPVSSPVTRPPRAGTRWSSPRPRWAVA